jgi:hypothetical protein
MLVVARRVQCRQGQQVRPVVHGGDLRFGFGEPGLLFRPRLGPGLSGGAAFRVEAAGEFAHRPATDVLANDAATLRERE